jgi:hypothetical protein
MEYKKYVLLHKQDDYMRIPLFEPLRCIPKTFALLRIHPARTLGLMAASTLLSVGAVWLGKHLGLPDNPQPDDISGLVQVGLLNMAVALPMVLYLMPMWALATDAHTPGESRNSAEGWRQSFETRWGRAFLARILLAIASCIGVALCIFPGFLVLLYFGWTPWRVLLLGEPISEAARNSAKAMAQLWPQVCMAIVAIVLIVFVCNDLVSWALGFLGRGFGWHASNIFAQFSVVWMNAALLGLFQWMEATLAKQNASGAP